jgi:hypothetical protein
MHPSFGQVASVLIDVALTKVDVKGLVAYFSKHTGAKERTE